MQAFLIERLFSTGWRRDGELFWQLSDAISECERSLDAGELRAARIIPVKILTESVFETQSGKGVDNGN
ncbi:MAG: hypothetical protein ABFC77_02210 [Thermoguttaceae bacterium]